jgi:beta-glucosidase
MTPATPLRRSIAFLLALASPVLPPSSALAEGADARAQAAEQAMTDEERFQLLHSIMPLALGPGFKLPEGAKPGAGFTPGISRLGIPPIRKTDASLGVTNPFGARPGDVATAMPSGLALAATFDPHLAYSTGATVGSEARAKGFNMLLGGGLNLTRDPRNGRNFEYLGEDPLLAGIMAGEAVRGTQSQRVVSTLKHFALNAQETLRQSLNAVIDEGALRESDLLAFEIAIERGQPGAIMCAYNRVNGPWACGSDFLLNQVLKRDWKYLGWVISDWGATHSVDFAAAGLDQQAGAQLDDQVWFAAPLKAEVAAGRIPRSRISDMARRILRSLYAVGADAPIQESEIDYAEHSKAALKVAQDGIVLLKNDGILPLAQGAKNILVVGGHADVGVLSGGGSSQVSPHGGAAAIIPVGGPGFLSAFGRQVYMPSSPVKALRDALGEANVRFDSGYYPETAAAEAKRADMVVIFASQWTGEGLDAGSMILPEGQAHLIDAVAAANRNVVVVLETGNPVLMPWLDRVRAVVQAWYPGQQGGRAIADILTGKVNPSGRLPMTFPASEAQTPRPNLPGLGAPEGSSLEVRYNEGSDVGYRWFARTGQKPLFPFGHGLSYTSFVHAGLHLSGTSPLRASFSVSNGGAREGADVPQLYLISAAGKPVRRLVGFSKVHLRPGETRKMSVEIDPRLLANWSDGGWTIAGGSYGFALGTSADELGPIVEVKLPRRRLNP